jgi:hypothetical protein
MRPRDAIRLVWTAVAVGLIGVLVSGAAAGARLGLLTAISLLATPSRFATAPVAGWLIGWLDVESTRALDLITSVTMALGGYVQWFVLPALVAPALRRKQPSVPARSR